MSVLMCVVAAGLVSCGGDKSSPTEPKEDTTPTPKTDIKSPEDARRELGELNIEYSREAFIKAVENEDVLAVALFIDAGMDPNTTNDRGGYLLVWAVDNGKMSVVKIFVDRGRGPFGAALLEAVRQHQTDVVEFLVSSGDRLGLDTYYGAALRVAIRVQNSVAFDLMLERDVDVNALYEDGSILMLAAELGDLKMVRALLDAGADINFQTDSGWTALLSATPSGGSRERQNLEVMRMLLEAGADVDARQKGHWTALMYASSVENLEAVRLLVEAGADVNVVDSNGNTALSIALERGYTEIADYLREHGATE